MVKTLKISEDVSFPLDAITQKFAILGRSSSGKTYCSGKFVELLYEVNAQVVIMDPIGNWWGLRLGADGTKKGGLNIPVIGGSHGDAPIEATGGNAVADLIVDNNTSLVCDISEFTQGELRRFITDFATHFLKRKKSSKSPVMVIWEECQDMVPQKAMGDEYRMLGAMEKLIKQGRNYGIGTTLISQRPQAVNKDVLNQTECMMAFQMTAPHERKAVELWIHDKAMDTNPVNELPKLRQGECFIWSPGWLQIYKRTRILKKKTYDASATPEFGTKEKARELIAIDLDKFGKQMQASIARARENDPAVLKKKIQELEQQLKKIKTSAGDPADKKKINELTELLKQANVYETLWSKVSLLVQENFIKTRYAGAEDNKSFEKRKKLLSKEYLSAAADRVFGPTKLLNPTVTSKMFDRKDMIIPRGPQLSQIKPDQISHLNKEVENIGKGERRILIACGQFNAGVDRSQLTVLTGYKRSSRDTYIQRLKEKDLITNHGDKLVITVHGAKTLGTDYDPLPTGIELQQYWMQILPKGEKAILEALVKEYPHEISRDTLSEITGYLRSSRDTYIQRMSAKEIIQITGPGSLKASDNLF